MDSPTHVSWHDNAGATYSFEVNPIWAQYRPDRYGVYVFCYLGFDGFWKAVYWGETDNFQRRLFTDLVRHHQWEAVQRAGATHIGTLHVPGPLALREDIETRLRHAVPTPCNLQINWLKHLGL